MESLQARKVSFHGQEVSKGATCVCVSLKVKGPESRPDSWEKPYVLYRQEQKFRKEGPLCELPDSCIGIAHWGEMGHLIFNASQLES